MTAEVTATDGHPFWVPELDEWMDATDLQPGHWLQTSAGTYAQVTAVERWSVERVTVHNLTVANIHTYYVLAGTTPVLVHNTCPHPDLSGIPEDLHAYIENSVWHYDNFVNGGRAPGVGCGGIKGRPGIYGGAGLPPQKTGYYTETDLLPKMSGGAWTD